MGCSPSRTISEEFISDAESKLLNETCHSKNIQYFFITSLNFLDSRNDLFKAIDLKNLDNCNSKTPCYVIKAIPYESDVEQYLLQRELHIMDIVADESLFIKYIDSFDIIYHEKPHKFLVMNFYHNFDLFDFETSQNPNIQPFSMEEKIYIAFKMLKMLEKLKRSHILHHDIKLENFLLKKRSPIEFILTDFETAEIIDENSTSFTGTLIYIAPEILLTSDHTHDYQADLWSLGVTLYALFSHFFPFGINTDFSNNLEYIQKCISQNKLINPNNSIPYEVWECISAMLIKDPSKRITVEQSLQLDVFKQMKYAEKEEKRVVSLCIEETQEADKIAHNSNETQHA